VAKIKRRDKTAPEASGQAVTDKPEPSKSPSFGPDRKGEASAGALAKKDKLRSVPASRDGSNTR
jgi:hypothetical protein